MSIKSLFEAYGKPGICEKMRIELVVIRERLGTKIIDFKGKGRLDLN
jgi:hypothetical protein